MKKLFFSILIVSGMGYSPALRADLWGGDVVVLTQILANAIKQLVELDRIVKTGRRHFKTFRDLHSGINSALEIINTTFPNTGSEAYKDWQKIGDALRKYEKIYGTIENAPNMDILKNFDRSLAEALVLNNSTYGLTDRIDFIGNNIKSHSQNVSPKGAAKLTAQSMGVVLQTLNQSLRTQSSALKIQAQHKAHENKKEKMESVLFLEVSGQLKNAMKTNEFNFTTPRF